LQIGDVNIAIDCGPDFRQQMLRANVTHLDAILITHEHNDHVIGLDDVRPFNFMQRRDMPIYATDAVQQELRKRFAYAFDAIPYPGAPRFQLLPIHKDRSFDVAGISIMPIEVLHGTLPVLGFRIGNFTYLTDVKTISSAEMNKTKGTKVLVTSALHIKEHYSHANLSEALDIVAAIQPAQAWLTHISHSMGLHVEVSAQLPRGVELGYDGLTFVVS
jgi:phosphoribosyl 1,2-cyclic phosphate phosphodiesterase